MRQDEHMCQCIEQSAPDVGMGPYGGGCCKGSYAAAFEVSLLEVFGGHSTDRGYRCTYCVMPWEDIKSICVTENNLDLLIAQDPSEESRLRALAAIPGSSS